MEFLNLIQVLVAIPTLLSLHTCSAFPIGPGSQAQRRYNPETDMLLKLAAGQYVNTNKDAGLQGILDGRGYERQEDELSNIDAINEVELGDLIVQRFRVGRIQNATTFHPFNDTSSVPTFTRTENDYNADFIVFMNPSYPPGTGHYVVLRRLAGQTDLEYYALDEELSEEEQDNYDLDLQRANNDTDFTDYAYEDAEVTNLLTTPVSLLQSGEENYIDLYTDYEEESNTTERPEFVGGGPLTNPTVGNFTAKIMQSVNASIQDEEVVYEAFSVNFRESLHGYMSDIDPLQWSFLRNLEENLSQEYYDNPGDDEDYYNPEYSEGFQQRPPGETVPDIPMYVTKNEDSPQLDMPEGFQSTAPDMGTNPVKDDSGGERRRRKREASRWDFFGNLGSWLKRNTWDQIWWLGMSLESVGNGEGNPDYI